MRLCGPLSTHALAALPCASCRAFLQETAAIIIEPVLGEGGFLTPPPGFLSALRALCDEHGMLLIFDEARQAAAAGGGVGMQGGAAPPAVRPVCRSAGPLTRPAARPPAAAQVQCGVARTGRWWGHQHLTDVQPDLLLFAKGIASGVPFAGVSARPELYSKMSPGMMVSKGVLQGV